MAQAQAQAHAMQTRARPGYGRTGRDAARVRPGGADGRYGTGGADARVAPARGCSPCPRGRTGCRRRNRVWRGRARDRCRDPTACCTFPGRRCPCCTSVGRAGINPRAGWSDFVGGRRSGRIATSTRRSGTSRGRCARIIGRGSRANSSRLGARQTSARWTISGRISTDPNGCRTWTRTARGRWTRRAPPPGTLARTAGLVRTGGLTAAMSVPDLTRMNVGDGSEPSM